MRGDQIEERNSIHHRLFFRHGHKPQHFCWVSGDNSIRRDVFCNHAPGTDHGVFAHRYVAEYGGTRPNRGPFANPGLFNFPIGFCLQATVCVGCTRIAIVDKGYAVPNEDIVFDIDALADEGVARNFAASSDSHVLLHFDECADFGLIPDFTIIQIDETREFDVFSEPDRRGNTKEPTHRYTISPRLRTDLSAASKSFTTLKPLTPSLNGDLSSLMHFKK